MKIVYWLLGLILGIPTLLVLVMYAASELGGEVVTLDRAEANGDVSQVRIWIVDENEVSWIEHGEADSFWIARLPELSRVVLTRGGRAVSYVGSPDPNSHGLYHRLRSQKYGVADQIVGLMGGSADDCQGMPVRLQLID